MKISNYEQTVINILKSNNILFKREQSFVDLKGFKEHLRFDFIIYNRYDNSIAFLLEVNGEQHYKEISIWGGKRGLQQRKEYDRKKISYALIHNIPLICLPYWEINNNLTYTKIISNSSYRATSIWHNDQIFSKQEKQ